MDDHPLMPYIRKSLRVVARETPVDAGELTFAIQQSIKAYLDVQNEVRFQHYCTAFGALVCAGIDLAHRKLLPYEERKREENGDVW